MTKWQLHVSSQVYCNMVQCLKVLTQLSLCSYSAVLLKRFLDSQSEQPDPYQHMALVLTNLTRQMPGRQLLLEPGKGTFGALASQLRAPSALRRKGCANAHQELLLLRGGPHSPIFLPTLLNRASARWRARLAYLGALGRKGCTDPIRMYCSNADVHLCPIALLNIKKTVFLFDAPASQLRGLSGLHQSQQ